MQSRISEAMWRQLFQRFAQDGLSLQAQIRQMLVSAILDGLLPQGVPITSCRKLADQLNVARNTVVLAYQQLVDEGYIISRQRSGFFVNPDILKGRVTPDPPSRTGGSAVDWQARFRFQPSAQRSIVKVADWQGYPYPFIYGQFDPAHFPTAQWRECCMKLLSVMEIRDWAPDFIAQDDQTLVEQIRSRVLPRRGVWAAANEIVVTIGAQQALYLLADLLVTSKTTVGIEDPGYPDARNIFASRTTRMVGLPVDGDGLVADADWTRCDYIYVTPSHHCPSAVTMPIDRREALLRRAERDNIILIEDDYESENNYSGTPNPALKSLDHANRVIYIGSLSKSFAPGLRLGYIVGPEPLIEEIRALRRLMVRHPAAFIQRSFSLFLSLGHYDALLRRLSLTYRRRAEAVMAALDRHLPDCRYVPVTGGASCWVRGPAWLNARILAAAAEEQGILIEPGNVFFMDRQPCCNYFRLGFSSIDVDRIDPGIRALGTVMRSLAPAD